MSRRTVNTCAGLVAAIAILVVAAPADAAKKITCSSGTTLLASKDARVFTVTRGKIKRLLACRTGGHKVRRIGRMGNVPFGTSAIERETLRLTRKYLAYTSIACTVDETCETAVSVVNTATGNTVLASFATPPRTAATDDFVSDVVVSDTGHVAWISYATNPEGATPIARYVMAKAKRTGAGAQPSQLPLTLGTGLDIAPTSLALGGGHVYWTQAATARSALLP